MTEHPHPIHRRQALTGLGSLGVAALLAACGKSGTSSPSGGAAAASTGTSGTGATTATTAAGPGAGTSAASGVAAILAGAGSCAVVPELTEGPYYIDVEKVRSDIREDRQGMPLTLAIRVRDFPGCTPRANAVVDV